MILDFFPIFAVTVNLKQLDITAHIRELLFGHDCVILPGFGGFIGNYTPARIDKTTNTFFPPVKQISFNRNLNNNDGLLAGKISAALGINYGDARNIIEQFAHEISGKLSKGEKVVFDHIGSFTTNHEGNIQFEPDREANYHLNSYGLTSFQFMPLEGYDARKKVLRHSENVPVVQTSLRKYLWRAAIIVPLVGILVAVPFTTNIFKTKVQTTSLNPLAAVEFENNRGITDSAIKDNPVYTQAQKSEPVNTEPAVENEVPAENNTAASTANSDVFAVITGSFQSEGNAAQLMKKLTDEGYSPELMKGPNGFYRVCAVKCKDLPEAIRKKDSIGGKYSGTWVSKIR
jgi:nucleoid DNA-binding protein